MGIIGLTDSKNYQDIADAIRLKAGTSSVYLPSEMALAIRQISGGGAVILQDKTAIPSTAVQTIVADSGYDGLGNVTINAMTVGSVAVPTKTINVTPSISVNSNNGVISVSVSGSSSVEPDVEPGYVNQGTAGLISVNGSNSLTMNTKGAATITPSTSKQTIAANQFLTGAQTINAIPSDYIIPSGSQTLTQNKDYDVRTLASVTVNVSGDVPALQSKSVSFTPLTVAQNDTVEPDDNYDGLSYVNISVAAMPSGSAGTPVATKGSVSNNQISITPSVSNTSGYIEGGTKTGTSVTVAASELVSGSTAFTDDGTYDVTNYASAEVAIDYVAKTVPVTFINHTGTVTSVYRSTLNSTVISTSTGYITNGASTIVGANSTVIAHFPAGYLNFVLQRGATADNFEIQVDGSVVTPAIEWAHKKMYSFGSSGNPVTGWTIDIYNSSDPWPELVSAVPLSVTANGTYTALVGNAYNPVTVAVPNTYEATDEGKVVSNGALVAQSSDTVTSNNTYDTTLINSLTVNVPTGGQINNQNKSVNPTESQQSVTYDNGYTGLGTVTVGAISSDHIGSNIARKSSADLTASGSVITAPAGYYSASASKAVAAGSVAVPNKTITANPTISVSAAGVITASVAGSSNVSPTVTAGYVTSGTQGTMSVSGSSTFSLTTQAAATITPSESQQTAVASQRYTTGNVVVAAISADYVGSSVTRRSSADLTASSSTITAPAGYYASAASKTVSTGTAGTPTATKGTVSNHSITVTPSVTNTTGYITGGTKTGTAVTVSASELASGTYTFTNSGTINVTNYASAVVSAGTAGTPTATKGTVSNHSVSITPSVTNTTGWITGSTKTGTAVTVNASELVSGSSAISSNGTYDVTNYASAVVSINYVTYYTGRDAPSSALGQDGDIYLQL